MHEIIADERELSVWPLSVGVVGPHRGVRLAMREPAHPSRRAASLRDGFDSFEATTVDAVENGPYGPGEFIYTPEQLPYGSREPSRTNTRPHWLRNPKSSPSTHPRQASGTPCSAAIEVRPSASTPCVGA